MPKLSEMNDSELFVEFSRHLEIMCSKLVNSHKTIAKILTESPSDVMAKPMLEFSMYIALNTIGDLLNGLDLVDEHAESSSSIFEELRRRFE